MNRLLKKLWVFGFRLGLSLTVPLVPMAAIAQTKGITFQGILKRPDGSLVNVPGMTANLKVLTPNGCVLRDEDFGSVNITNGYINLVVGKGTTNVSDPGKTIPAIMNNTTAITGLNCLDSNNNVVFTGQTYTPTSIDSRKLRLSLILDGNPVIMDFNMRSMPFAVNSETLNGKLDTAFINTNSPQGVTQPNLESIFARFTKLDSILDNFDGTGAVLTGNASNVTGTVAVANGGTGATTAAGARTNLGLGPLATLSPGGTADNTTYLRGDGTWAAGSSGAVTSVAGRTGVITLTSADLTDFNTASDTRADGRITAQKGNASGLASLDGSGKVPSTQLALVASDIPNLDAAKITSGTITQNVSATSVAATTGTFTNLRVYDGTANFLTQTAPAAGFTANYTVQWPAAIGTNGQALRISSVAGAVATLGWVTPDTVAANTVTGTGTTNTLPKFTGASTLGDSLVSESASAVVINGRLALPATSATLGQVTINGSRFMHNYAGTFLGADAGNFTSTGGLNTGVGSSALGLNTSGSNNTAMGIAALRDNTTGSRNASHGDLALSNNTTGDDNTALGHFAGTTSTGANANVTGSQNTYIGSEAGPGTMTQLNNSTAIGYNARVNASNSLVLGDNSVKVGIGSVTAPSSTLDFVGDLNMRQMAAPAVSAANSGRIYFDSTSKTFQVSQNNGAYVNLVGAGGTVTSVGLALPAEITVSNSPVTTTGTLTGAWANQTTNKIFAAPNGSTGAPTFRALANADLPVVDIAHGGTGLVAGTSGGIPYFDATTTMASSAALTASGVVLGGGAGASPTATAAGAAYQPFRVPAGGGAPAFGAIDISQAAAVTGTLAVANGGTGITSFSNYSVVGSNGSGGVISIPGTAAGSLMQYSVTGPVWTSAVFPVSTTANQLLYSSANNVVGGLATANSSILTTDGSGVPSWGAISSDVFSQYAILAGRAGGQTLKGGTAASENLTLDSTAHATKGYVLLNPTGGNVGIGTATPATSLDLSGALSFRGFATGTYAAAPANQGRIFYDSTLNKFQASQNTGGYVDLLPAGGAVGGTGTTGKFPKFTATGTIGDSILSESGTTVSVGGGMDVTNSIRVRAGFADTVPAGNSQLLLSYSGSGNYTHSIRTRHNSGSIAGNAIDFYTWRQGTDAAGTTGTQHVMTLDGTGNVGIGTATPSVKLDTRGSSAKATTAAQGDIFQVASTDAASPLALQLGLKTDATANNRYGSIEVDDGGTARDIRLQQAGGNVVVGGIGVGMGWSKFHLHDSSGVQQTITTTGNNEASIAFSKDFGSTFGAIGVQGTDASLRFSASSSSVAGAGTQMVLTSTGNVGIGTTSPRSGLDVNSTILGKPAVSNGSSTIDFSTGNIQYTTSNCGSFQFNNLKDGGSYTFIVQGATSATCTFTGFSDAGVTALTVHMPPDNGATIVNKHTIFNVIIGGTHAYVAWTPGY